MSTTATQPAPQMTGEDARTVLMRNVFAPAFFDKLATHGIVPASEEEAVSYLRIGEKLLAADREEQVKQASSRVGFLKQAEIDLDAEYRRRYGAAPAATVAGGPSEEELYAQKMAAALGEDATIQDAVEAFNAAVQAA